MTPEKFNELFAPPALTDGFKDFMKLVDRELEKLCGLTSADLPDYLYIDDYEDGFSARITAKRARKAAEDF